MTNKIQDAFESIKASEELKSSTLQFLRAERAKRSRQARWPVGGKALVAACAMLVMLVGAGGYYTVQTPVAYLSIDVNPSVELALNRYDRVVSATAYNEDGEIVLEGVDVNGKRYTDAVESIVESAAMQPYLTENAELTVTVAADDEKKETVILSELEACSGFHGHGGRGYTADPESLAEAHDNGLSFGKYAAYLVLSQYDSSVTPADCQKMSMAEIHCQISEHENAGWRHGASDGAAADQNGDDGAEVPSAGGSADCGNPCNENGKHGAGHGRQTE